MKKKKYLGLVLIGLSVFLLSQGAGWTAHLSMVEDAPAGESSKIASSKMNTLSLIPLGEPVEILSPERCKKNALPGGLGRDSWHYEQYQTPEAVIHVMRVDPKALNIQLLPEVSPTLETVEGLFNRLSQAQGGKKRKNALPAQPPFVQSPLWVMNAGYFDPLNGKTTSYLEFLGQGAKGDNSGYVLGPEENERLMKNSSLKAYLPKILNRSEVRFFQCDDGSLHLGIARHQEPIVAIRRAAKSFSSQKNENLCIFKGRLGAGPSLLPQVTLVEEGFVDRLEGGMSRDPLGVNANNARSALGMTAEGDVLMVVAQQTPLTKETLERKGLTIFQLAEVLKQLGASQAIALDGGSSSSFCLRYPPQQGATRRNGGGVKSALRCIDAKVEFKSQKTVKRAVKSFLVLSSAS
ncbi:MAG: phosphodiester glycosidase family protein [Cyanobacteria bacterium]|nr:phosphodiester glycosidase family protein [Cyanobacteriota bacterium]